MSDRLIQPDRLKQEKRLKWSSGIGTDVWKMFSACITGDLDIVRRLADRDLSIVRAHYEYRTPLSFAVRENHIDIAALLLDRGADPFAVADDLVQTARERGFIEMAKLLETKLATIHRASPQGELLAAASRERDLPKVRALLDEKPELLNLGDRRSNLPIHWAVMTRQLDMIDELLERGADINARRADGARPIQLTNGDYHFRGWRDVPEDATPARDVLAHLRARGADCDLSTASFIGDIDRVRELLAEDRAAANRPSDYVTYYPCSGTPLRNAAAGGHLEIVKLLLAHGADPNLPEEGIAPRGHALYSAVYNGHFEIAVLLLESGADPNAEVESSADALSIALMRDDQKMADLLCCYGASRPVHLLAYYGDVRTAAAVFAANPSLANDADALVHAAENGHEAFVRLMLRYVPDLPQRVSVGAKPAAITELLFRYGMNPSQPSWLRVTPLHRFADKGDLENAAIFIDHGADLHARDEEHRSTPLAWAARSGRKEMVELLLKRGAKPTLPDDPPWATPLAWATRRDHQEIVGLLRSHSR